MLIQITNILELGDAFMIQGIDTNITLLILEIIELNLNTFYFYIFFSFSYLFLSK